MLALRGHTCVGVPASLAEQVPSAGQIGISARHSAFCGPPTHQQEAHLFRVFQGPEGEQWREARYPRAEHSAQ